MQFKRVSRSAFTHIYLSLLKTVHLLLWTVTSIGLSPLVHSEELFIFTMNDAIPAMSKAKARMIFLGKIKNVRSVGQLKLMDWPATSPQRADLYKNLLKKTPEQINNIWASQAFSGRGTPPHVISNPSKSSLRQWLIKHPTGIAYAPQDHIPEGAKILLVVK